jgi:hypothetical protein
LFDGRYAPLALTPLVGLGGRVRVGEQDDALPSEVAARGRRGEQATGFQCRDDLGLQEGYGETGVSFFASAAGDLGRGANGDRDVNVVRVEDD